MSRVLLLGMNNPHRSGDPLSPMHGAGRRLFEMSGLPLDVYEQRFERRNLVQGRNWTRGNARRAWKRFKAGEVSALVLLGREVACIAGIGGQEPFSPGFLLGLPALWVWHPSGLCRAYNEKPQREALGRVLRHFPCERGFREPPRNSG